MLLALSHIVRTHFFDARPPQMDPIVTTGRTMMRWEGFSGCCGVYARLDLEEGALHTESRGFGTTNVDFNPEMLSHLGRIGRKDEVGLSVSTDAVEVQRGGETVREKSVTLPKRWIKGLCEVQVYQSRLRLRHRFSPAMIVPLMLGAARGGGGTQYLAVAGNRPRLTLRRSSGVIAVGGTGASDSLAHAAAACPRGESLCRRRVRHSCLGGRDGLGTILAGLFAGAAPRVFGRGTGARITCPRPLGGPYRFGSASAGREWYGTGGDDRPGGTGGEAGSSSPMPGIPSMPWQPAGWPGLMGTQATIFNAGSPST